VEDSRDVGAYQALARTRGVGVSCFCRASAASNERDAWPRILDGRSPLTYPASRDA